MIVTDKIARNLSYTNISGKSTAIDNSQNKTVFSDVSGYTANIDTYNFKSYS